MENLAKPIAIIEKTKPNERLIEQIRTGFSNGIGTQAEFEKQNAKPLKITMPIANRA